MNDLIEKSPNHILRINPRLISSLIARVNQEVAIPDTAKIEMAIPSYLNRNYLVRSLFWGRYDRIYRLAKLEPGMRVCEFGCGLGMFLPTLVNQTAKVYAIDLFPQYAQSLSNELDLGVTFLDDIIELPEKSLDIIFAVEVMEHLEDPMRFAQLFYNRLKPEGKLIVSSPTETALYKFGRFLVGYNKYHEYHKQNAYQLREIILKNGFTLEKTIRYPSPLLPLNLIFQFRAQQ